MKSILGYLKDFWKKDFDLPVYSLTVLGLVIAITLNYTYDFEDRILDSFLRQPIYFLYNFLYYGAAYFYVIALYLLFKRDIPGLYSKDFWIRGLFFMALLAFKAYFLWGADWISRDLSKGDYYMQVKTLMAVRTLVAYGLGLLLFYMLVDKVKSNWYGMTTKGFNWRPYFFMLLFMIPLIAFAATQPDFLRSYPRFRPSYFGEEYWTYFAIYEPFYLAGFVMVEWMFRGFLVVGMVHLLGHRAILPAAAVYCIFHFGKPMGECISSFFGGYILGVFAYYTRSIWGGIIVHMGIALMMDLAALLAKYGW